MKRRSAARTWLDGRLIPSECRGSGSRRVRALTRDAAVRAEAMGLTTLATAAGAFFVLDDPIFSRLALARILGTLISTQLMRVVITILFYSLREVFRTVDIRHPDAERIVTDG